MIKKISIKNVNFGFNKKVFFKNLSIDFSTKNLNKVAQYIINIFNNEKKYNKLCNKSYKEYEKNYSKKQILKKLKFYLN